MTQIIGGLIPDEDLDKMYRGDAARQTTEDGGHFAQHTFMEVFAQDNPNVLMEWASDCDFEPGRPTQCASCLAYERAQSIETAREETAKTDPVEIAARAVRAGQQEYSTRAVTDPNFRDGPSGDRVVAQSVIDALRAEGLLVESAS